MGFADWDLFQDSSFTILNSPSGINDGSLLYSSSGTTFAVGSHMQPDSTIAPNRGALRGKARTLIQRNVVGTTSSAVLSVGLYAMTSLENISTSGSYYALEVFSDSTVNLGKGSGGIDGVTTLIGTPTSVTNWSSPGDIIAIELEWDAINFLPDVKLIGRLDDSLGSVLDFSGLVEFENILDTVSPLTSSTAEGIFFRGTNGVGGENSFYFDETTLFEVFS